MAASAWEFLLCTQIMMHAMAHGGCKNTPRESALQVDVGRKIHGCTDWGVELVCVCVCVVSVIVKRPVLPPCVVDGRFRNPLYYYYCKNCILCVELIVL